MEWSGRDLKLLQIVLGVRLSLSFYHLEGLIECDGFGISSWLRFSCWGIR